MLKKLRKMIFINMEKYDRCAKNPFLKNDYKYNPFKSMYEQTYIWVEKNNNL